MAAAEREVPQGYVVLARLVRPQGRHGEILSDILTDFPERFAERRRVWLLPPDARTEPREVELERAWLHKGRVVLKLAGVDSINDAEALRGYSVGIPREERAAAEEGAFYIADLVGCAVVDEATGSTVVGTVRDVERSEDDAADLLVVEHDGEELLIPFAKAYLVAVDLEKRTLRMSLPAGLAEINAPMNAEERAAQQAADDAGEDDDAV